MTDDVAPDSGKHRSGAEQHNQGGTMSDEEALKLIRAILQYATEYGRDTDPEITVVEMVEDLSQSMDQLGNHLESESLLDKIKEALSRQTP